jgi:hypothetical protein
MLTPALLNSFESTSANCLLILSLHQGKFPDLSLKSGTDTVGEAKATVGNARISVPTKVIPFFMRLIIKNMFLILRNYKIVEYEIKN